LAKKFKGDGIDVKTSKRFSGDPPGIQGIISGRGLSTDI